jgi:hypothetical protein
VQTDCIKDLGVHTDRKFHFHRRVGFVFPHALKLLRLIRKIPFSSCTIESLWMLYFALVRSKLECSYVAWGSVTATDSNKLERTQHLQPFATIDFSRCGTSLWQHIVKIKFCRHCISSVVTSMPHFNKFLYGH